MGHSDDAPHRLTARCMTGALITLCLILLVGCSSARQPRRDEPTATLPESAAPTVRHAVLTSIPGNGPYEYELLPRDAGLRITAPAGAANVNQRQVFWMSTAVASRDQRSCATWDKASNIAVQNGIALRITQSADRKVTRALTVTTNVWGYAHWYLDVHAWNSTDPNALDALAQFDLTEELMVPGVHPSAVQLPWHVCAQAIGNRLSFKIWTGTDPEPPWTDSSFVHSVTIPPGWDHSGLPGGYIGHIDPGQSAQVSKLSTPSP